MRTAILVALLSLSSLAGCAASHHPVVASRLGQASRSGALLSVIDQPGPLEVETVASASWKVSRAGLINLAHEKARAAGLEDTPEPIHVAFHVIRHPVHGTFILDTGVERAERDAPDQALFSGLVGKVMHREWLEVREPLGDWLARQQAPLAGVLLSHLHLDHVAGLRDVPARTPLYAGPGETSARAAVHLFSRGVIDRALEGKAPLNEWPFAPDPDGRFAGVVDVFGDGSLWALWTPGHTAGSTAYLARTEDGPVLFTGDTSHTRWGWDHDVEPGEFTVDPARNAESLAALRRLAREHPGMRVVLGHQ